MKVKVSVLIVPNGQGKNEKSKEVTKNVEVDFDKEDLKLGEIM